jgi:hypothetical protein
VGSARASTSTGCDRIVAVVCLLLALLARMESRARLESIRVPEILRVDRI